MFYREKITGHKLAPYLFLLPSLFLLSVFVFYPIIYALYGSLFEWSVISPERAFVGIGNFRRVFDDIFYWQYLRQTLYYAVGGVVFGTISALLLALFVNSLGKLSIPMRTMYFLPVVTPVVAIAIVWQWIFQPQFGLLNYILSFFGIPPQDWIMSSSQVIPSLIIMGIWHGVGYSMVIFLAGLQSIPQEYYEAAMIDGASSFKRFQYITLPLLAPTFTFLLVTGTIGGLQVFSEPYILTGGGPGGASRVTGMYIYDNAFRYARMGLGCAQAFVLFGVVLVFSLLELYLLRRREVSF